MAVTTPLSSNTTNLLSKQLPPPNNEQTVLPPPAPPRPPRQEDFPPGSLAQNLLRSPTRYIQWQGNPTGSTPPPTLLNSVTLVIGSPHVCGIHGTNATLVTITPTGNSCPLIDGGSNICITGDLHLLVDLVDIPPVAISVALDGPPLLFDDTITKRGLLPLTLSNGTTYYQPCYYCANMVETIISPAAVLAASYQLYYWTQVGYKDPTTPGSLHFTSRNGCFSLPFDLKYHEGLYCCTSDVFTVGVEPVRGRCHRTVAPKVPNVCRTPSRFAPTSKARQVESEVWKLPSSYTILVWNRKLIASHPTALPISRLLVPLNPSAFLGPRLCLPLSKLPSNGRVLLTVFMLPSLSKSQPLP